MADSKSNDIDWHGVNDKSSSFDRKFLSTNLLSFGIFLACYVLFSILRVVWASKFNFKDQQFKIIKTKFLSIRSIWHLNDDIIYQYAGYDAYIYLVFLRHLLECCVLCVIPFGIFLMAFYNSYSDAYFLDLVYTLCDFFNHFYYGKSASTHPDFPEIYMVKRNDFMASLTFSMLHDKKLSENEMPSEHLFEYKYIIPTIGLYIFTFIWYAVLSRLASKVAYTQDRYFLKETCCQTVLVSNIPKQYLRSEILKEIFEKSFGPVESVKITQEVYRLEGYRDGIALTWRNILYFEWLQKEENKSSYCCFRDISKELEFYKEKLLILEVDMDIEISFPHPVNPVALITFVKRSDAVKAISCRFWSDESFAIEMAPAVHDLKWHVLSIPRSNLLWRRVIHVILDLIVTLFWFVPASGMVAVMHIENLHMFGVSKEEIQKYEYLTPYINSYVPPLILSLYCYFIRQFMMQSVRIRKTKRFSTSNEIFTYNFFLSLILFVLIFQGMNTIMNFFSEKSMTVDGLIKSLATGVLAASTVVTNYVITSGVLFQAFELIGIFEAVYWFFSESCCFHCIFPPIYNFDTRYWYGMHMLVISSCCCYAVVSPFILVCSSAYFAFCFVVHGYNMIFRFRKLKSLGATNFLHLWSALALFGTFTPQLFLMLLFLGCNQHYMILTILPLTFISWSYSDAVEKKYSKFFEAPSIRATQKFDEKKVPMNPNDQFYVDYDLQTYYDTEQIGKESIQWMAKYYGRRLLEIADLNTLREYKNAIDASIIPTVELTSKVSGDDNNEKINVDDGNILHIEDPSLVLNSYDDEDDQKQEEILLDINSSKSNDL